MSQRSVLSASLKVAPPLFPFISVISHLSPSFSLTFLIASSSLSLSLPAASLFHSSASLALHLTSLRRCLPGGGAAAPGPSGRGVPDGLAGQKVPSWPLGSWSCPTSNPRGVRGREHVSHARREAEDRDQGGREENCVTAEPVIYCISSSNSLRGCFFPSARTPELFEARAHTLRYHSSDV